MQVIVGMAVLTCAAQMALAAGAAINSGSMDDYRDERTGARVRNLTPGISRAHGIYQTHPMWTSDMEYFLFFGDYNGKMAPYARHMKTGHIRRLLDEEIGASALDPKTGRLYYVKGNDVCAISVGLAFRRMAAARKVASRPDSVLRLEGGISVDSKSDLVYSGALLTEGTKWGLIALSVSTGRWQSVTEVDFHVGHVQANPSITRVIMFCHETGGDAPQRTWVVNANGTGLRPFYKETYNEWVTHEVWWGGLRALFTIWPYDEEHKKLPYGVAGADLASGKLVIYSEYPAWHTQGSPDGKWIVGDDFERNIWLIKPDTKERRLLTQGHLGKGFDTHPHPSFAPDSKAVVFTSSKNGVENVFMADLPAWESLPLP